MPAPSGLLSGNAASRQSGSLVTDIRTANSASSYRGDCEHAQC